MAGLPILEGEEVVSTESMLGRFRTIMINIVNDFAGDGTPREMARRWLDEDREAMLGHMTEKDQQAKAMVVEMYSYAREYASKTHPYEKRPYPEKFADFVQMCMTARMTPKPSGALRLVVLQRLRSEES